MNDMPEVGRTSFWIARHARHEECVCAGVSVLREASLDREFRWVAVRVIHALAVRTALGHAAGHDGAVEGVAGPKGEEETLYLLHWHGSEVR